MLRSLTLTAALVLGTSPLAIAASHTSNAPMQEIPQGVILATSVIGMPTFIKAEQGAAGPIGTLADAIVSLDGTIMGVVIRTANGRALAVPAPLLEQGRVNGRPVLFIDITREQAESAPDVSDQMPSGAGDQSGVMGTTTDGTNAMGQDEGSSGTGTEGRAGTDGEPVDADTDESDAGDQSGVTGTTTDGTNAMGQDEGSSGTGTEGRAGTDGEPVETNSN